MSRENIRWLVDDNDQELRLIWIDDLFFPLDSFTPSETEPAMGHDWIDAALQESLSSLPPYGRWLMAKKQLCIDKNVAFAVTNFEYCQKNIDTLNTDKTLFLVDVENRFVEEGRELYGYQFVAQHELLLERVRFYTRYLYTMEEAARKFSLSISLDEHGITPSTNTDKIAQWIDSMLLHEDSYVRDAIRFYASYLWTPTMLHKVKIPCLKALADWLKLPVKSITSDNNESAKCLVMWDDQNPWGEWEIIDPHRSGRKLQVKVLKAVCQKLGIPLSTSISEDEWIRMPCDPSLPFLISLRSLLGLMERENRPVQDISFRKYSAEESDVYMLSLQLQDSGKRDAWGLADRFFLLDPKEDTETAHTTSAYLRAMTYCRTAGLSNAIGSEQAHMRLFRDGTNRPVVSLHFGPYYIHILWTATTIG